MTASGTRKRIWQKGEPATRPNCRHDAFNALVWLAFPAPKRPSMQPTSRPEPFGEGPRRDALTHLDECGVIVTAEDASLLDLYAGSAGKRCSGRGAPRSSASCAVSSSAIPPANISGAVPRADRQGGSLRRSAGLARWSRRRASSLTSMPGWPPTWPMGFRRVPAICSPCPTWDTGVVAGNAKPDYYDDEFQFRPGRRVSDR